MGTVPGAHRPPASSGGRVAWIIFCCFMAASWFIGGLVWAFATFGIGFFVGLAGCAASLAAILVPVGKPRQLPGFVPSWPAHPPVPQCDGRHPYGPCPQQPCTGMRMLP